MPRARQALRDRMSAGRTSRQVATRWSREPVLGIVAIELTRVLMLVAWTLGMPGRFRMTSLQAFIVAPYARLDNRRLGTAVGVELLDVASVELSPAELVGHC